MLLGVALWSSSVRAAIYCRISQDRDGEALGVGRQETDCRALCERLGWDVGDLYIDNDLSAYNGKTRPGYHRLLTDLESGAVEALACWDPDRLHRSPLELEHFIGIVERQGAQIAMVMAGGYDLQTANGKMVARMLGAAARHESEHKAERQRRKLADLAAAGKAHGGGSRPFGYVGFAGPLDESEAELVREAARRLLAGDGVRRIVVDWNNRGIGTSTGKHWTMTSLKRVLRSGRVAGLREYHGEVVAIAEWPAILDRDTWEQICALLNDPARRRGGYLARKYLLTGFIRCGKCGGPMYARPRPPNLPAYSCVNEWCTRIAAGAVEDLVSAKLRARIASEDFARLQAERAAPGEEDLAGQILACEAQLEEWARDKVDGLVTRGQFLAATQRLDARLTALRRRFGVLAARSPVAPYAGVWMSDAQWVALGLDRQRAMLAELVERVAIRPVGKIGRFDESRVRVHWLR